MEKKLKILFDYLHFEKNERLEKLIRETESRHAKELSDDDLSLVNAAGETDGNVGGSHIPKETQAGGLSGALPGGLSGESKNGSSVSGYNTGGLAGNLIDGAGSLINSRGGGGGEGAGGNGTAM